MQKINFDKTTIIFSLLVLFLALELFLFLPASIKRIKSAGQQISVIGSKLRAVETEWPKKTTYLEKVEQHKQNIKSLRDKFVEPQQESKVLSFISSGTKDFDVEIIGITPGKLEIHEDSQVEGISYLPINVTATSGFHNFLAFLNYLQDGKYFFQVEKLNMLSQYPRNSVDLTISALVKKE